MDNIFFAVPAMSVDVYTTVKGKKVKKLDERGRVVTDLRVIPKERARSGRTKSGKHITYTDKNTRDFEAWIRRRFFKKYPDACAVKDKGKFISVYKTYIGCQWYGEDGDCVRYRQEKDFALCKKCSYRRKNLSLRLTVYLKDERHIDLDNMVKIVLDSLNKVCFYDDSQFMRKEVELVQNSAEEHLKVAIDKVPTGFRDGSLVGNYSLKRLPLSKIFYYISSIGRNIQDQESFFAYLLRSDNRKEIENIIKNLKEGKNGKSHSSGG